MPRNFVPLRGTRSSSLSNMLLVLGGIHKCVGGYEITARGKLVCSGDPIAPLEIRSRKREQLVLRRSRRTYLR